MGLFDRKRKKKKNKLNSGKTWFLGRRKYSGFKSRGLSKGYVKTVGGHKSFGFLKGVGKLFKKKNKNKIGGSSSNGNVAVHSPRVGGYGHQKPAKYSYKSWADFGSTTPGGNK